MKQKITCVHLYNDFSGSPRVLANVVRNFVEAGMEVEVMTSEGSEGFLSKLKGVTYNLFEYKFFQNKKKRAGMLLRSQVGLFSKVLKTDKDSVVYVNTLLPFGAALAGKISGRRVIYHLHETTVNPPVFKRFLKWVAKKCASEVIYVSNFLQKTEPLSGVPSKVVYNTLSADFKKRAARFVQKRHEKFGPFTVLMLCSLKKYKGVDAYVRLAEALPKYRFLLVLNAGFEDVKDYFDMNETPQNLVIFPSQKEVHTFYEEANLVVNLSHPEQWVETFGMTLLEGMTYGIPVIAPPVGGPAELVISGENGFQIDQRNLSGIVERIRLMAESKALYHRLSINALSFSKNFDEAFLQKQILETVGLKNEEKVVAKTMEPTASAM